MKGTIYCCACRATENYNNPLTHCRNIIGNIRDNEYTHSHVCLVLLEIGSMLVSSTKQAKHAKACFKIS